MMLDAAKLKQIRDKHSELQRSGRLPSDVDTQRLLSLFQERFGLQMLRGLTGEKLLQFMHGGSKDSLAYWLEFKNDEEFDTRRFGSIAGGSALKFRLFQRKATGHWQAANSSNYPEDISLSRAVEMAESHKSQLVASAALLEDISEDSGDDDYARLQEGIEREAPDIFQLGWVHKYLFLTHPTRLDDFHAKAWQRFHLLKLLQMPPAKEGLYASAGRYVAGAREAGVSQIAFDRIINDLHGSPHRYWRVGTTTNGDSQWKAMRDESKAAVGWPELGDLSWVQETKDSREKLRSVFEKKAANHPSAMGNACNQIVNFIAGAQEGDVVLAADGQTILGLGRLKGPYEYHAGATFPHQRRVEWTNLDEWELPVPREGLLSTFREIKKHDENLLAIEKRLQARTSRPRPAAVSKAFAQLDGIPGRIQSILERKSQVILYGPPGTGKTFWAERTACDLASISTFGRRFDELSETQRAEILGTSERPGLVRICCFHPGYGYEDFLEGYRPHLHNSQVAFQLRDGVFKRLCSDAAASPEREHFLVIDEINRGDIPRVFGELLTILEKDKRGKHVVLPVSQEPFAIPKNVFVIGTMNTADRSISLLDAALRRRFGFLELMPDPTVLKNATIGNYSLQAWFEVLNQRIRQHVGRDARNLQVGHSYFLQGELPLKDAVAFKRALRDDMILSEKQRRRTSAIVQAFP